MKFEDEKVYYIIEDSIGAPRELVDSRGTVTWSMRYKLWGRAEHTRRASVGCSMRFQGQWFDEETGLHYNRFRYYDPDTGRFISQDPTRLAGGRNLYSYAPNPLNWIDPFGLGTVFRGMKKDSDGQPVAYSGPPENGQNAADSLGIRPTEEGMSTNVDPADLAKKQPQRAPPEFGGTQGLTASGNKKFDAGMFAIDEETLAKNGLRLDPNDMDGNHRTVIPAEPGCSREEFERRLAASRDDWKEVNPEEAEKIREAEAKSCPI
jgi:RHS repeat-associated protein